MLLILPNGEKLRNVKFLLLCIFNNVQNGAECIDVQIDIEVMSNDSG
jgi:hypothetical protein